MSQDTKRFVYASATLVGTIIGVGIFGIPYALSKVGAAVGIVYFVALTGIQLLQHLFYAETAIASTEKLRLVGLSEKYLGRRSRPVAAASTILGFWGGILAYMIVGGTFLHVLLSPFLGGGAMAYQIGWSLVAMCLVYFGLDLITKIDFVATIGLLAAMMLIFVLGLPHVEAANIVWPIGEDLFLPYGVILFSLSGATVIPEMEDILKGRHRLYHASVIVGTIVAAVLTAVFGFIVWGVTGPATSQSAVDGLKATIGDGITVVAAAFGFLAVATSFFATAINLQSTFEYDYKLRRPFAWLLTGAVPFGIFLMGAQNFIPIVSFTGAVFGGIASVLIALLYVKVTKKRLVKKPLGIPLWVAYLTIAVLALGAAYETIITALALA